jgi:hypothetical protein|tara:strand:+ start:1930 stop:2289 length:360 start_codon:yes stop_codon:yes gene_type:complete
MLLAKQHTELDLALIAQQIESLTPGGQVKILGCCGTYRNLFTGPSALFPQSSRKLIKLIREKYQAQNWDHFLAKHHEAVASARAIAISLTSEEYPLLLKQISRSADQQSTGNTVCPRLN